MPGMVIKDQFFIKSIFMLFHMDQQCLLKSQVSMHLLGTNTTLLSALYYQVCLVSPEDLHQHKVRFLATKSSCHEHISD